MAQSNEPPLTVKCRCPANTFTLAHLAPTMKFEEFQAMVHEKSGIAPSLQLMKTGFPPAPLDAPSSPATTSIGTLLSHGDLIVVSEKTSSEETTAEGTICLTGPIRSGHFPVLPSSTESCSELTTTSLDGIYGRAVPSDSNPDEELDRAIALSLSEAVLLQDKDDFEPGPVICGEMEDGSCIIRRFVDSDNSCLFTAVAYLMEGNRLRGFDLRSVIAAHVRSDPHTYNEAVLGRPNAEYCEWIVNPQHWGGEIELMILSQHYRKQIATYDIQTTNCYVYGSDSGFLERVMLVYDGIHYDALALSPYKDAPEELDQTVYNPLTEEGLLLTHAAVQLVQKFNATNQFTNTSTFRIRCDECGRGFTGTSPAVDHQRVTGHVHYSEYR